MVDETTEPPTEQQPPATPPENQTDDAASGEMSAEDARAEIARLRKENAARRVANRELEEWAERGRKAAEAEKTQEERIAEQMDSLKRTAEQSTLELSKVKAALAAAPQGMTPDQILGYAARLQGSTLEEIEADAQQFFSTFPTVAPAGQAPPTATPVENLRSGAAPGGHGQPSLDEQIRIASQAGDHRLALDLTNQKALRLLNPDT